MRTRAVRATALAVASFAVLALGALVATAAGGSFRLLLGIAGFIAYVILFGRAVREFDLDRLVWHYPDWMRPRVSGRSLFSGERPARF